ncbi:hypothetical protein AAVH_09758 [Aphelenchoides avenae]|nr:hypothetical protein AAVH_09758 [Aphelenchus avenae]
MRVAAIVLLCTAVVSAMQLNDDKLEELKAKVERMVQQIQESGKDPNAGVYVMENPLDGSNMKWQQFQGRDEH